MEESGERGRQIPGILLTQSPTHFSLQIGTAAASSSQKPRTLREGQS